MAEKHLFAENDYQLLSGIQHFAFCPRQWALIHIEGLWEENYFTAAGRLLHQKTHDGSKLEKRGNIIITRALKISSATLGISGECDVVEFHKDENGIALKNWSGCYTPYPVEYKRGKMKLSDCDRLQLCAQAMCLEEMLCCKIPAGALYYGEPKRREVVEFDEALRAKTTEIIMQMHELFQNQHTPSARFEKHCNSCSLKDTCMPMLMRKKEKSVKKYLEDSLL